MSSLNTNKNHGDFAEECTHEEFPLQQTNPPPTEFSTYAMNRKTKGPGPEENSCLVNDDQPLRLTGSPEPMTTVANSYSSNFENSIFPGAFLIPGETVEFGQARPLGRGAEEHDEEAPSSARHFNHHVEAHAIDDPVNADVVVAGADSGCSFFCFWSKRDIYRLMTVGVILIISAVIGVAVFLTNKSKPEPPSSLQDVQVSSMSPTPPTLSPVTPLPTIFPTPSTTPPATATPTQDDKAFTIGCLFIGQTSLISCQEVISFDSNVTGGTAIPTQIGSLTQLRHLVLKGQSLTGIIPSSIGGLTRLTFLDLSSNALTGSIPSSIGSLTLLKSLDLSGNTLTGSVPASIGNLTKLTFFGPSGNRLTGKLPSTLGSLTKLTNLWMSGNLLTGRIPSSLGNLTQLNNLDLAFNQLTGTIPSSIGSLTQLNFLGLYMNYLSGPIPSSIGSLTQLKYFWFHSNRLTGTIPMSIGSLTQVTSFSVSSNNLNGTIPDSMGNFTQVASLELSGNQLTGSIPSSFGSLTQLEFLQLGPMNTLTGTIPLSLCSAGLLSAYVDCQLVQCSCCFDQGNTDPFSRMPCS